MKYQDPNTMTNDVMLVTEDGEVVAAGTRDQMYSFVKHNVEGIVWPVAIIGYNDNSSLRRVESNRLRTCFKSGLCADEVVWNGSHTPPI